MWDILSLAGIFITGYGDSDSHKASQNWYSGNNFASWIAVDENESFPVSEDVLIRSMKTGDLYMGDPVFLKFGIKLECEGARMGQVIHSDKSSYKVKFSVIDPKDDFTVKIIGDSKVIFEGCTSAKGNLEVELSFSPEYPLGFLRAEMYNSDGRCIMLTNPIYFANKNKFFGKIPEERIFEV